jgi:hypothetical protein
LKSAEANSHEPAMDTLSLAIIAFALGAGAFWYLGRRMKATHKETMVSQGVAERVRAIGKLVGLEVAAKEIVTTTSGWSWMPPLLLSQARLAMIFQFEKQYAVDLSLLRAEDIESTGPRSYTLHMPPIEGTMRLVDVMPYDIQGGRVLGLVDVMPMNAGRQRQLMAEAQTQAASLIEAGEDRYHREARASIERHLRTLLGLFDLEVDVVWPNGARSRVMIADEPVAAVHVKTMS